MAKSYRQWVSRLDGLDEIQLEEVSLQEPGDKEVLLKIHAVSLNFRDIEVCTGTYDFGDCSSPSMSRIVPCSDAVGTVVKAGKSSSWGGKEGQRALSNYSQEHLTGNPTEEVAASGLGLPLPGVLAEYRVFPDYGLVTVPDYLSDEEACTLPIAAVTAWMSLNWLQPLGNPIRGPEMTVLFQGTGGVSVMGLQIGKAAGLTTIVTSSSDHKLERARALGADHLINYKTTPDWDEEVMKLTHSKGADIILETGGAKTIRKSFLCISYGGSISCVGYLSGKEADDVNVNVMALRRNVTIKGIWNGPKDRFEEMLEFYDEAKIHPVVDRVFGFGQAKDAFQYLFEGSHFGKVVIKVT